MVALVPEDAFGVADALAADLQARAIEAGLGTPYLTGSILRLLTSLVAAPNSTFPEPPAYRADYAAPAVLGPKAQLSSSHSFFDVVKARASRRDFGDSPMSPEAFTSVLAWTFGRRGETIAYDWRNAPLRYVSSAGGLACVDAYPVVLNVQGVPPGSYYYDYERGLVPRVQAEMSETIAALAPGSSWVSRSAAVVVVVADASRVDHKYKSMGAKLSMLDAGVALGHLELVAAALELRACILGGLSAERLAELFGLEQHQVPIAAIALGTRS